MDVTPTVEDLDALLDEKCADIRYLISVIREIYAIAGEDDNVSRLCNSVLSGSRFAYV